MAGLVGIDVGGTFTDLIYSADGMTVEKVLKVPSTPDEPSRGLIDALKMAEIDPAAGDFSRARRLSPLASQRRRGARQ